MIDVKFYYKKGFCRGFYITGHSNFSESGFDIVCAGVSSAVQMCINGIEEILKASVFVSLKEGAIFLKTSGTELEVQNFLEALKLQLSILEKDYNKNIKLSILEEK